MKITAGNWDSEILDRCAKISSLKPVLDKYQSKASDIDLSSSDRAILKLNK
jgi:hypothetical protein